METFTVRIWTPGDEERPDGLRGTARHVRSGLGITFTEAQQLVTFLVETVSAAELEQPALMPGRQEPAE
jgi:hypothetical protein